jgi:hypothetical protein
MYSIVYPGEVSANDANEFMNRATSNSGQDNDKKLRKSFEKTLKDKKFSHIQELKEIRQKKKEDSVSSHDGGSNDEDFSVNEGKRKPSKNKSIDGEKKKIGGKGKIPKKTVKKVNNSASKKSAKKQSKPKSVPKKKAPQKKQSS